MRDPLTGSERPKRPLAAAFSRFDRNEAPEEFTALIGSV